MHQALTKDESYFHQLNFMRSRPRRFSRAPEVPTYDQLVILEEEEQPQQQHEQEDDAASITFTYSSAKLKGLLRPALKLQAVYRAHLVRSQIQKLWGWNHFEVTTANMKNWNRKIATKKIQKWWRGRLAYKKYISLRQERIRKKQKIEDEFESDPSLRRVLVVNREARVSLTAIEETHGTQVRRFSLLSLLLLNLRRACIF